MSWLSLILVAVALAMDAFAVSVASSFVLNPPTKRQIFRMSFHFGLFQAIMPIIGWAGGNAVYDYIAPIDHWIAFGLLCFVGVHMIYESGADPQQRTVTQDPTKGWILVFLSIATSIDALAVGLSLAMIGNPIVFPAVVTGIVAAAFSVGGMLLGRTIGQRWSHHVEIAGGLLLIAIGIKILVEHLYF